MQTVEILLAAIRTSSAFRFLAKTGVAVLLLSCFAVPALAQDLPDVAQGLQPYASYHGGEVDNVSTVTGGLNLHIPLLSYPQKGSLSLSYSLIFNSYSYQNKATCDVGPGGPHGGLPIHTCVNHMQLTNMGYGLPVTPQVAIDEGVTPGLVAMPEPLIGTGAPLLARFYAVTPDGAQHPLGAASDGYRSLDESGYLFVPSTALSALTVSTTMSSTPGTITDSHGIVYTDTGGTSNTITDPDGNAMTLFNSGAVTDSIDRSIPTSIGTPTDTSSCPILSAPNQPLVSANLWTPPGSGSGYLFCYATVTIRTHTLAGSTGSGSTQLYLPRTILQSIVLPNGTYWGFEYDSDNPSDPAGPSGAGPNMTNGLAQLNKLILPTGGWITYTYQLSMGGACDSARVTGLDPLSIVTYIPQVATRTMFDKDGTELGTWTYAISGAGIAPYGSSGFYAGTTITSPLGDVTQSFYQGDNVQQADGNSCGVINAGQDVYQGAPGSGTLLKSTRISNNQAVMMDYPMASANRVLSTTTTLNDGSNSTVSKSYSGTMTMSSIGCDWTGNSCTTYDPQTITFGGPTSTSYTDFSGAVLKSESTAYAWQSIPAYLSANFVDIPSQTVLKDGSGTPIETTTYTYDESSYAPSETTVRGHLTSVSKTLDIASGPAPTVHTGWNTSDPGRGERAYVIDARGYTTSYAYDGSGGCSSSLVTSTTNALSQSISGGYDCNTGLLTSLTDLNGNTTSVAWDSTRRITAVTYPSISSGTPTTTFSYTDSTNTVQKTVAASPDPNQTTTVTFDGFGREATRVGSDGSGGATLVTTYDLDGRVSTVTNPYHSGDTVYSTSTTYDALGRPLVVTKPDSNTTTTSYTGPTTDSWDENNTHMQHTTDALGRLVKVMELGTSADPRSLETDYTYDAEDSLTYVNQHGASGETPRTRSFTYDSLARLITSTNPETGTICYGTWSGSSCLGGYDANSNLLYKTDANSVTMSYTYDALNRLTNKSASNGSIADNYLYDWSAFSTNEIGRLGLETSASAGTVFYYDAMGHNWATNYLNPSNGVWYTGSMVTYDLASNPYWMWYADGRQVNQSFDTAGRLTSATDAFSGTPYFSSAAYTAAGALTSASYGNGVTEAITYNSRLQPCHTSANSPALAPISGVGNVFDRTSSYANNPLSSSPCYAEPGNNGNTAYIADNLNAGWTQSFGYDGLNRLLTASRSDAGYNHTYNYDSFGNLLIQDNITPGPTYTISPASNQLNRWYGPVNEYTYDAAGNLTNSGTSDIGGHSFAYNPLSQITTVDGGTTATYSYNGMDQRIFKQTGSGWTGYVYMGGQPMAEYTSAGVWTDYIYAEGQKIAKITNAGALNYYLDDHLGTTQIELDASGNVTWQGQFTPFGSELDSGGTTMHYKFTGKERDAESGLDFFGARYYASTNGRWMSPDWSEKPEEVPYSSLSDPQSLNLYNYVGNNPLSKADADGHWPDWAKSAWQGAKSGAREFAGGLATTAAALGGNPGAQAAVVQGAMDTAKDGYDMASHPSETIQGVKDGWKSMSSGDKAELIANTGVKAAGTIALGAATDGIAGAAGGEGAAIADSASVADRAASLSGETGATRVDLSTPSTRTSLDLTGKAHFDKATGGSIPTPHVHENPISIGPNGQTNLGSGTTRAATHADIDAAAAKLKGTP